MHHEQIKTAGEELGQAKKVLLMIHGRGGSAEDILALAAHLQVGDYTLLAPQATGDSWYPLSFLAPPKSNEPWLSSALQILDDTVQDVIRIGIAKENICFLGFSQGACLMLEYVARNAARYGGVIAFTGGLIGDKIYNDNYQGDFARTPLLIASSDPDPHVPVERVYASVSILKSMNAAVTEKIYRNMGHTINQDELDLANEMVFKMEMDKVSTTNYNG